MLTLFFILILKYSSGTTVDRGSINKNFPCFILARPRKLRLANFYLSLFLPAFLMTPNLFFFAPLPSVSLGRSRM